LREEVDKALGEVILDLVDSGEYEYDAEYDALRTKDNRGQ
jgi:hypothetical protein